MQVFAYIKMSSPIAFRELLPFKNNHDDSVEQQNNTQLAVQKLSSTFLNSQTQV